ncbi:MAG: FMN-binding protein, partial [Actinomycetes bacterium]
QTAADATVAAPATSATPSKAATKKKAAATATATKKAAAPAAPATAPNTARSASPSAAPAAKPATKPAAAKPAPKPTPKPTPKPAPKPAPKPTPTPTVAAFKDYLGAVAVSQMGDTVYGKVQVTIRVSAGKVTALAATFAEPHSLVSKSLSNAAMLQLRNEVITAQSASVANVSGATYTSAAFKVSLQSALHAAGLA